MAKTIGTKDSPDQTGVKADLYTIVKRRRRTVKQYLAENGVTTRKGCDHFIKKLKEEYSISKKFVKECDACFPKLAAVKPSKHAPEPTTEEPKKPTKGKRKK